MHTSFHAPEPAAGKRALRMREPYWRILSRSEIEEIVSNPDQWVADTVAALITGIPRGTLRRFRAEGRGPRYRKTGRSVRYKVAWLLEYIAQTTVETSETGPRPVSEGVATHG
jgi:hypothetical protein